MDTLHGALAEPLAVAMHAVSRAGSLAGRDILVNGAGPIGSLVIAAAKYAGARTVIATDINDASLRIAKAMGADEVLNVSGGGALPQDMELVFEATGIPAVLGGVLGRPPAAGPWCRWATCPAPRPPRRWVTW